LLEVNIINICPYVLNVNSLILSPEKENVEIIKVNETKLPLLVEPEEELNFVYIFPNYENLLSIVRLNNS
jgi:hypothetical protein